MKPSGSAPGRGGCPGRLLAVGVASMLLHGHGVAAPDETGGDPHSYANFAELRVRHIDLDLRVDFDARRLSGHADLSVTRVKPAARTLILDTRDLEIESVSRIGVKEGESPLRYTLGEPQKHLGQPLQIEIPEAAGANELKIRVRYRTQPEASGLQWLAPEQTAGKKHPFLFSQSQAIHARSWIPLQDSPQVRLTYSAVIHTPANLQAVMAAAREGEGSRSGDMASFRFEMREPIPPYLFAIAAGDLAFRAIGPRTGVYAEPALLDAAAKELADLEDMVTACERLFGPYRWGRYDLLVLPPSFPYGGMENPRLTFLTPTIIAGDRSLVSLIAHELAHSWSGNLVTNASWRDFWLNEGFTVYLERRIVEAIYGERRAAMEDVLGLQSLQRDLDELPPGDEVLAIDLRGRDPDEGVTDVPYEKGKLLLAWLESRFGRERLDAFLRGYFDHFAFQSITTEQFLEYLNAHLVTQVPGRVSEAELREWIYEPGIPAFAVLPRADVFAPIDAARQDWLEGRVNAKQLPSAGWSTQEWLHFLDNMPERLSRAQLLELDRAFGLTDATNAEIAHSWFRIAIRNDYEPAYDALERYLVSIGRRKLIRPLYEELMKTDRGAERARAIYARARPGYHPIAAATLDTIVTPTR